MQKMNIANFSLLMLMSLMLALTGCGGGGGGSSNLNLVFKIGAIFDTSSIQGGGIMYAQNATTGGQFAWLIPPGTTAYEKSMNNGSWTYQVIVWSGTEPLTGIARCGTTSATLSGSPISVPLELSAANCNSNFTNSTLTGITNVNDTGTFLPLRLVSCTRLSDIPNPNSNCDSPLDMLGQSRSFKVSMVTHANGIPDGALTSACINHEHLINHKKTDSVFLTDISLPAGGSLVKPFIRFTGYDDVDCTLINRNYDFSQGLAQASELDRSDIYRSAADIEAAVRRTEDPYATTTYPAGPGSGDSGFNVNEFNAVYTFASNGCSCAGMPGDITCTTEATYDGYTNPSCPNGQMYNEVTRTGTNIPASNDNICKYDFSNQGGPNCDGGTITFRRVVCQGDGSSNPAACSVRTSETVNCNGEGTSTCRFGANAPHFLSVYLADSISGIGGTPFASIAPDFTCNGGHCLSGWLPGNGSGSGTGFGSRDDFRQIAGEMFGLPDGSKPWKTVCPFSEYISGTGTGTGGGNYVNWRIGMSTDGTGAGSGCGNNNDGGGDGREHLELGSTGEVREWLIGDGIGGFLFRNGYTTCSEIPTVGSEIFSGVEGERTYNGTIYFYTGDKSHPNFSNTGTFQKKIVFEGTTTDEEFNMEIQFNCTGDTKVGYMRMASDQLEDGQTRYDRKEIYYDGTATNASKLEVLKFDSKPSQVHKSHTRFDKVNEGTYAIWQMSLGKQSSSGSGSGTGSGSGASWYGTNSTIVGDIGNANILRFHASRNDSGFATEILPSLALGNHTIVGSGQGNNGTRFNYQPADIDPIVISGTSGDYVVQYDDSLSGAFAFQHVGSDLMGPFSSYFGTGFTLTNIGSYIYNNGFYYVTNGRAANSIMPFGPSANAFDITFADTNISTIIGNGTAIYEDNAGVKFKILGSNGCCSNYFALAPPGATLSSGSFKFVGGANYIAGNSISAANAVSSQAVCVNLNGTTGGCTAPSFPSSLPSGTQFSSFLSLDFLVGVGVNTIPGP